MHFAQIAKELREDTGLSQQKLADKLGLSSSGIARWELGQSEPGSQALMIYAKYFGVSTDYLLGLEDDFGVKKIAPATNTGNEGYSAEERQLIEIYRTLDNTMRETLWSLLNTWKPSYIPLIKKHSKQ